MAPTISVSLPTYAPVKGPYAILQTAYDGGLYNTTTLLFGDPSIPGSPDTIAALETAPEPETWLLLVIGFCAIGVLADAADLNLGRNPVNAFRLDVTALLANSMRRCVNQYLQLLLRENQFHAPIPLSARRVVA